MQQLSFTVQLPDLFNQVAAHVVIPLSERLAGPNAEQGNAERPPAEKSIQQGAAEPLPSQSIHGLNRQQTHLGSEPINPQLSPHAVIRHRLRRSRLLRQEAVSAETVQHRGRAPLIGELFRTSQALLQSRNITFQHCGDRLLKRRGIWWTERGHIPLVQQRRNGRGHHRTTSGQVFEEFHRIHVAGVVVELQRQQGDIGRCQIPRQLGIGPGAEQMHMGMGSQGLHVGRRIRFTDGTNQHIGPLRSGGDQGLQHRQIELVGIDGADEDQAGPLDRGEIRGTQQLLRTGPSEMLSIGNIAEQMRPGIERCQLLLQLRSCREHGIDGTAQILFCAFKRFRRHAGLRLDAVDAVIDRGLETPELQIRARVRVEGPQQRSAQIQTPIGPEQRKTEAPAVESPRHSSGPPWKHQWRHHPDALTHLPERIQASQQSAQDSPGISPTSTGTANSKGVDVEHSMTGIRQRNGQVLFVRPERMIPVRCGQEDDISHGLQASSSIAISRKLVDVAFNVSKSP